MTYCQTAMLRANIAQENRLKSKAVYFCIIETRLYFRLTLPCVQSYCAVLWVALNSVVISQVWILMCSISLFNSLHASDWTLNMALYAAGPFPRKLVLRGLYLLIDCIYITLKGNLGNIWNALLFPPPFSDKPSLQLSNGVRTTSSGYKNNQTSESS